ncbi:MAG TPA: hypothetical protein VJ867_01375, partial [Gemmatimonadaceae bacterium]|nr:hypothetical protein [Gemmatimonadaceae bacterium]
HPRLAKGDPFDAAGVRVLGATGNGITIENDAFIGGDAGVAAGGGAGVRVLNSRFVEQWDVAIQGGNGEGIYAEANDIKGCGPNWCIAVFGGKGSTQLLRNTITIDATRPVVNVIQVHDGDYEISGNTIVGTGGTRAKDDPKTWPIQSNAITVSTTGADGVATANITNNVVKGAFNGLGFNHTSSGTVTDNVVSDVGSPINFYYSTVAAHRNDFSGYITPFQFVSESSGSSATCNWWGSAYGPDAPPFIDALLYTPWSAQPIAGTTVACDPTPALPQTVRVCSVTDGSQTLHALTIARAVALVATGGKIELCDGTHVASVVWLSRDVTIEAEHPLAAIVDGAGQASLNTQFDATAAIALRGLVFTNNGTSNSVNAQNFRGSLVVDGSAFRLVASYPYNTSREGYQDHYTNGGIGIFDSPGSVTVRNSTFNGGDIGIHANNANLLVQQSHFSGQSNAGTFSGFAATVRVENSSYDNCGRMGCAKMFSSTGGRGEFVADTFTVTADHPVWTPLVIGLNAGSAVLEGNVITGVGGDGDRTQQSTYPIDGFAMQLAAGGGVVLNRNHITNAYTAMNYTPASGGGSDNVVSHVYNFLTGGGAPSGASANLTRNDITDYVVGVTNSGIFSTLNLRCNWWGTNAGPTNIGGGVLQASYTPWADQEIAGHPELPCTESYTIAFSDGLVDGNSMPRRLFVQQTDGTNPQVLAQYASDELGLTPAWSHDGSQIVFQVGVPQWGDLYLMDARPGATPVDITPPLGDGVDVGAAFAPDGRILYTSTRTGNYELWVRNTDGTQTQLTHTAAAEGGSAAFSPDGSQIAFARSSASGGYEIWVMNSQPNADGTYTEHQVTNIGGTCGFPRWTPDGRLLFGGGPSDLFLYFVNANASMATMDQLTAVSTGGIEATMSDISSDGRKIIFDAFRVGALYVMNADGSGLTKVPLPTGVTANYPRFKPVP